MTVSEKIIEAVRDAGIYNPDLLVASAYFLWPDGDSQRDAVIHSLPSEIPELRREEGLLR